MPTPPIPDSSSAAASRVHAYGDSGTPREAVSAELPDVAGGLEHERQCSVSRDARRLCSANSASFWVALGAGRRGDGGKVGAHDDAYHRHPRAPRAAVALAGRGRRQGVARVPPRARRGRRGHRRRRQAARLRVAQGALHAGGAPPGHGRAGRGRPGHLDSHAVLRLSPRRPRGAGAGPGSQRRDRGHGAPVAATLRGPRHAPDAGRERRHRRAGARGHRARAQGRRARYRGEWRELGRAQVPRLLQGGGGDGGRALLPSAALPQLHAGARGALRAQQ